MEFIIGGAIIFLMVYGWRKLAAKGEEAERWLEERRQQERAAKVMASQNLWNTLVNNAETYPVGIVGEASYQDAIEFLTEGEIVELWHEPANPYDKRAIAVAASDGDTIGYLPRDLWLRDAVLKEGKPVTARVMRLAKGAKVTGVTIEVALAGMGIRQRPFKRAGR